MPRSARVLIDGGTYHVLTRGNNGQPVFLHEADCERYLQLLASYANQHRLKVYHFVLMPNHVHLVLEVPVGPMLSRAMSGLNLSYSLYFRKRHRYSGHLWQGRFHSLLINRDTCLLTCGRDIELNPVRAGLVQEPGAYPWSSYQAYAQGIEMPCLAPHPLYEGLGATADERQERYRRFIREGLESQQSRAPQIRQISADHSRLAHQDLWRRFAISAPTRSD